MRIGIHKLGFPTMDNKDGLIHDLNDKNGMFTEVNLLIRAFKEFGYDAEYIDLTAIPQKSYSHSFIFNGFEKGVSKLHRLSKKTNELNYIITDSRFFMVSEYHRKFINKTFVQSNVNVKTYETFNSKLHKLPLFENMFYNKSLKTKEQKNGKLIFGGSIRDRRSRINELLVNRPDVDLFLKDEYNDYDNRLPILEYKKLLNDYTFGLVIINPLDVSIRSITWRYYEYIANNVLTFIDAASDPYNLILDKGNFMYVNDYYDMQRKINLLKSNDLLYNTIIAQQRSLITMNDLTGKTFVDSLLESRESNGIW